MSRARRTTTAAHRAATAVVGVLVALPLVLAAVLATAAPAEASTYRYWTYWWGSGTGKPASGWTFAQVGPAGHGLRDTWVLGWRFATTSKVGGAQPRQSPDFGTLCPGLSAPVAGSARIALVIDYGTTADAPPGQSPPTTSKVRVECLTIPVPATPSLTEPSPTGVTVLNDAHVSVRDQNMLICALDGYPVGECAPVVPDPAPSATRTAAATTTPARTAPATPSAPASATARGPATGTSPSTAASTAAALAAPVSSSAAPPAPAEETLPAAAGAPAPSQRAAGSPAALVVGGAVVAGIAGSAWWTSRRRGRTT